MENLELVYLTEAEVEQNMDESVVPLSREKKTFAPDLYAPKKNQTVQDILTVKNNYDAYAEKKKQWEIIIIVGLLLTTGILFFTHLDNPLLAGVFVLSIVLVLAYFFFAGKVHNFRKDQLKKLYDAAEIKANAQLGTNSKEWAQYQYGLTDSEFSHSEFTVNGVDYKWYETDVDGEWIIIDAQTREEVPFIR